MMAKKPTAKKSTTRKTAAKDIEVRLVDAMLAIAEAEGWRGMTLGAIAQAAGAELAELHPKYGSRVAVLAAFMRRVDREVVSTEFAFAAEDTPRDRLFEVLMRRFDALRPHREALRRIRPGLATDPVAAAALMPAAACSMAWMLEAAGIPSDGAKGHAKAVGLAGVFLKTAKVWFDDDTDDMSRTMAALDRNLGRAGRIAEMLFGRRREAEPEAA